MLLTKILFVYGFIVLGTARSIHRYELGDRYYYLKALKQQEAAHRFSGYYGGPLDDYNFGYAVNNQQTGDIKSHKESRKGGIVKGSYELLDADGYKRIVDYTADDLNGFNAFVQRIPVSSSAGHFGVPFGTIAPPFATPGPFGPLLASPAPPTHRFGSHVGKLYPVINTNLNNYVTDYFNGYSEGSFHQYY